MWNDHACIKVAWDFVRLSRFRQYSALSAPAVAQVACILGAPSANSHRIGKDWACFSALFVDVLYWCHMTREDQKDQKRKVSHPRGIGR